MAKGQKRNSRETRKPKQEKKAAPAAAVGFGPGKSVGDTFSAAANLRKKPGA